MLYLNRKVGESIIINNNVELTVVEVKGNSAKLGFVFPASVSVLRKELHERIMEENMMAAAGSNDELSAFLDSGAEGAFDADMLPGDDVTST